MLSDPRNTRSPSGKRHLVIVVDVHSVQQNGMGVAVVPAPPQLQQKSNQHRRSDIGCPRVRDAADQEQRWSIPHPSGDSPSACAPSTALTCAPVTMPSLPKQEGPGALVALVSATTPLRSMPQSHMSGMAGAHDRIRQTIPGLRPAASLCWLRFQSEQVHGGGKAGLPGLSGA